MRRRSIHYLSHDHLKTEVRKVLEASSQGVMSRKRIALLIRQSCSDGELTGNEKSGFLIRINRAIAALQVQSPPVVLPVRGNPEKVKLVKHRKRDAVFTRKALMLAIRERVVSVNFRCAGCDNVIELTEFRENPQCPSCATFAVPE